MDVLYDRTVTCLVCKQTYTTKKVRSRFIRPVQHDTDFCSYMLAKKRIRFYITSMFVHTVDLRQQRNFQQKRMILFIFR